MTPSRDWQPAALSPPRLPALDGLRGFAVLLILVYHYVALSPLLDAPVGALPSYVRASLGLTFSGVDLFFVLSGFLIGGILLDHRTSPRLLPAFYARRALRILPLAWLSIGVVFGLAALNAFPLGDALAPWWIYSGFLTNLHLAGHHGWVNDPLIPHWSLSIEEQFYLIFPFAVRAWPQKILSWLGPTLIAAAITSRLAICVFTTDGLFSTHVLPFCRLDSLGAGFTCAWLVRSSSWQRIRSARHWLWIALLSVSASLMVLLKIHAEPGQLSMATWGYTSLAIFYGIILLLVYQPEERWLKVVFTSGWLRLYGRYSYFIYLFQSILAEGLTTLLFRGHWQTDSTLTTWEIAAVPLILLFPAAISWHFFESPFIRWGHRLKYA
jgi:peptidoglycan/LPS O-acetylase OafA/YrhL